MLLGTAGMLHRDVRDHLVAPDEVARLGIDVNEVWN
jgi:hypothetical protein